MRRRCSSTSEKLARKPTQEPAIGVGGHQSLSKPFDGTRGGSSFKTRIFQIIGGLKPATVAAFEALGYKTPRHYEWCQPPQFLFKAASFCSVDDSTLAHCFA